MLTDLQKRKLTAQFRMNDLSGNGYMERTDFERYAARICQVFGAYARFCRVRHGTGSDRAVLGQRTTEGL